MINNVRFSETICFCNVGRAGRRTEHQFEEKSSRFLFRQGLQKAWKDTIVEQVGEARKDLSVQWD